MSNPPVGELSKEELEDIRAFVENEDGRYPELADLPAWWDRTDPGAHDTDCPNYLARDIWIYSYVNWAFTKRWAWDGLNRLLVGPSATPRPDPQGTQRLGMHCRFKSVPGDTESALQAEKSAVRAARRPRRSDSASVQDPSRRRMDTRERHR